MVYRIAFRIPKDVAGESASNIYADLTESSVADIRKDAEPHYLVAAVSHARVSHGEGLKILRMVNKDGDHCLLLDIEDLLAQAFLMGVDCARKKPNLAQLLVSTSRKKKRRKSM